MLDFMRACSLVSHSILRTAETKHVNSIGSLRSITTPHMPAICHRAFCSNYIENCFVSFLRLPLRRAAAYRIEIVQIIKYQAGSIPQLCARQRILSNFLSS